jgi:hypothetical protein
MALYEAIGTPFYKHVHAQKYTSNSNYTNSNKYYLPKLVQSKSSSNTNVNSKSQSDSDLLRTNNSNVEPAYTIQLIESIWSDTEQHRPKSDLIFLTTDILRTYLLKQGLSADFNIAELMSTRYPALRKFERKCEQDVHMYINNYNVRTSSLPSLIKLAPTQSRIKPVNEIDINIGSNLCHITYDSDKHELIFTSESIISKSMTAAYRLFKLMISDIDLIIPRHDPPVPESYVKWLRDNLLFNVMAGITSILGIDNLTRQSQDFIYAFLVTYNQFASRGALIDKIYILNELQWIPRTDPRFHVTEKSVGNGIVSTNETILFIKNGGMLPLHYTSGIYYYLDDVQVPVLDNIQFHISFLNKLNQLNKIQAICSNHGHTLYSCCTDIKYHTLRIKSDSLHSTDAYQVCNTLSSKFTLWFESQLPDIMIYDGDGKDWIIPTDIFPKIGDHLTVHVDPKSKSPLSIQGSLPPNYKELNSLINVIYNFVLTTYSAENIAELILSKDVYDKQVWPLFTDVIDGPQFIQKVLSIVEIGNNFGNDTDCKALSVYFYGYMSLNIDSNTDLNFDVAKLQWITGADITIIDYKHRIMSSDVAYRNNFVKVIDILRNYADLGIIACSRDIDIIELMVTSN